MNQKSSPAKQNGAPAPTAAMLRLVSLGVAAALFFSSTFILNRAMSLAGGHWAWSASLRYFYLAPLLAVLVWVTRGRAALGAAWREFTRHFWFWTLAGGVGFGVFYSLITFAASYSPGWIVATTWQTTILATPVVLYAFGKKVPSRGIAYTAVIFAGIVLVNIEHLARTDPLTMLTGALPVLLSAFAYPLGNQLVWEVSQPAPAFGWLPPADQTVLSNTFARVLLLTLGSLPFWALVLIVAQPPLPQPGQWSSTALVALFSGVAATSLFLYARHKGRRAYEIAAVDSTQAMEVVFSLAGELLFLGGALPGALGWGGIALTILGLVAYILTQSAPETA